MGTTKHHSASDLVETWERFKSSRGLELQNWVEAERALAAARRAGQVPADPGDRLLAAEAALQSAIVDFAAAQDVESDPTPLALGLLRMAEDALKDEERGSNRRSADRTGPGPRRRPPRQTAR